MAKELKNTSVEECSGLYLNRDVLVAPATKLYRVNNHDSGRHYYAFNEVGEPIFFISVTTLIRDTTPTPEGLVKWKANLGYDEAQEYTAERAGYGTFMHICITKLIINRILDLDTLGNDLDAYMVENKYSMHLFPQWLKDVKDDLLAFAQWMIEYEVEPIMIEHVLASLKFGFAGAVDLACKLWVKEKGFWGEVYKTGENKGKPKETIMRKKYIAIVDFKSGRKTFYTDNEVQLGMYKILFEENFPGIKVDKLFNWSPKEWRTKPSYNFKDQTDSTHIQKIPYYIAIADIDKKNKKMSLSLRDGILDLDKGLDGLALNCMEIPLDTYVKIKRDDRIKELELKAEKEIADNLNNNKDEQAS